LFLLRFEQFLGALADEGVCVEQPVTMGQSKPMSLRAQALMRLKASAGPMPIPMSTPRAGAVAGAGGGWRVRRLHAAKWLESF
jgi:hypothetical protein